MTDYSHSRLSKFSECRQKYKFRYIDRIRSEVKSVDAFLGSRVHDSLQKLYTDANRGKIDTVDDILADYHRSWEKEWTDSIKVVDTRYQPEHYRARGESYLREYYLRFQPQSFREMRTVSLEESNTLTLPDGNRYQVKIDRLGCIGGSYFVCDYKTSTSLLTAQKAQSDRQLAMYALWVYRAYSDVQSVTQRWHMLHFDKDVDVMHSLAALEKMEESVVGLISEIENCTEFPSNTSNLCSYCEFYDICPEFKHLVKIEQLPVSEMNRDEGAALVNEYEKLESAIREGEKRQERIKLSILDYSQKFGADAVYGNGMVARVKETENVTLPVGFTAFLVKNGLLDKYGCVSHPKVKNAVLRSMAEPLIASAVRREKHKSVDIRRRQDRNEDECAEEHAH